MPRQSDKREKIIHSADALILKHGFRQTTLADIAEDSGVPLGNVYYYFKSKEDIGKTVIQARLEKIRALLRSCEQHDDPRQRLLAFIEHPRAVRSALTADGCPLGTLSYELARTDSRLREVSRELISELLRWCTEQFRHMDVPEPRKNALQLLSSLQGMSLIANTLNDVSVIDTFIEQNRSWLKTL